jgi:peptidoglycan/LPS O-acetylase OafA/YrhL
MTLPPSNKERFVFIDGLRGIAAVGVMFHHLFFSELQSALQTVFPAPLLWISRQGDSCVQIFFVISGFVIAWSLRNMKINAASALNFILRRQIRLDPAYWFTILFAVARVAVAAMAHPVYWPVVPRPGTILVNMLYLQNILHRPIIMGISWTLCLEVQLYLVYILLLYVIQRAIAFFSIPARGRTAAYLAPMIPLLMLSLWLHNRDGADAYFVFGWYLFGLGALICWTAQGVVPPLALIATLLMETAWGIARQDWHVLLAPALGATIYAGFRTGGLTRWLGDRVLQYFGRISYSLYLVHRDTSRVVMRLGIRLTRLRPAPALLWYALSMAACVGVAHLLHILVERPSMNLASRLKPRKAAPAAETALIPAIAQPASSP